MQDIRKLVTEVLDEGFILVVSTSDEQGPWSAPVTYLRDDDLNLYWLSKPDTRHSQAIEKSKQIAASVIATHAVDNEKALQISGEAEVIHEILPEFENKMAAKRGRAFDLESTEIRKGGYIWYKLRPKLIKLTYNAYFGYDSKVLEL